MFRAVVGRADSVGKIGSTPILNQILKCGRTEFVLTAGKDLHASSGSGLGDCSNERSRGSSPLQM